MEAFPVDYVEHNLPLVLLSGLGDDSVTSAATSERSGSFLLEGGFRIRTDAPPLTDSTAEDLSRAFLAANSSGANWNAKDTSSNEYGGQFRVKRVGRSYTLPPRKAPPPPQSPRLTSASHGGTSPPILKLHSTISPLTPTSPLYPDGIMTPLWIAKHQSRLPAAFIAFFTLTSDPNVTSLHDNQLKAEINNLRNTFASTNYKTKVVIILVEDSHIGPIVDLDERLGVLRRATSLDAKSLFFCQSGIAYSEKANFAKTVLSSIQTFCIEYYRDLSKHSRRKRSRSAVPLPTVPPTSGTSQVLPSQGWNTRYEFKLGIFAEFRQEMDAACRNYESAYESLFSADLFESIPNWTPRFNEARLLADVIAIRIIRCQLWTNQTTGAVRSWLNHRDRIKELVDRKGKGTANYGWEAWEATWSKTMAQLVTRSNVLPALTAKPSESQPTNQSLIFSPTEKAIPMGERTDPWELLHHEGFWLRKAQRHVQKRKLLALQIPEEHRITPTQSLGPANSKSTLLYDSYLSLEPHSEYPVGKKPGYDYFGEIRDIVQAATRSFKSRSQIRTTEQLELDLAKEHINSNSWNEGLVILRKLWSRSMWRQAGWWNLLSEVGWALQRCALQVGDAETLLIVEWELLNKVFVAREDHEYNLSLCLNSLNIEKSHPAVVIKAEDVVSCLMPRLCFSNFEGHVGEPLKVQLSLESLCQSKSAPLRLSEVRIVFEGSLRPLRLVSDEATDESASSSKVQLLDVRWRETSMSFDGSGLQSPTGGISSLVGLTNLSLKAGEIKVYNLLLIPREAGDVRIASISLLFEEDRFSLAYVMSSQAEGNSIWWDSRNGRLIRRQIGRDRDVTTMKILPKPPKMQIKICNLKKTYYTNEKVRLLVELLNEEDEAAVVLVEARLIGPVEHSTRIQWGNNDEGSPQVKETFPTISVSLPALELGRLSSGRSKELSIDMTDNVNALDFEIEITTRYHLQAEPETRLSKVSVFELPFIRPFEANFNFLPQHDPQPWPNFFEINQSLSPFSESRHGLKEIEKSEATGVNHKYAVIAKIFSFATEKLMINDVSLVVQDVTGGVVCHASRSHQIQMMEQGPDETLDDPDKVINPDETQNFEFFLDVQKIHLADRQPVNMDLAVDIRWKRIDSNEITTSTLELPRFVASMAEPRVLLTTKPKAASTINTIHHLDFVIENPSMHFLTFNLTMESSEDFAFSGPKAQSVSLVPLSRHSVEYKIISPRSKQWIRVNLGVVDAYFNKTLRVLPASRLVKADKKHNVFLWVD